MFSLAGSLGRSLIAIAAFALSVAPIEAGPIDELKSLSQLPSLDLAKLKQGHITTARGTDGNFARGISLESCYFIPAPMATVGEKLLHWDPTKHPGSQTRLYQEYTFPAARPVFQTIRLDPSMDNDGWILDHTLAVADGDAPSDLHLTAGEIALIRKEVPPKNTVVRQARIARVNKAWGEILRDRSHSLTQGGMAAIAPYTSDKSISPGSEFRGLFTLRPKVAKYFQPLLSMHPLAVSGTPADEAVGYWEAALVRGHTTLQLGLFAARKSPASWQLIDCVYYPSDTYFMALDVFQLWPVNGGTLVWQVGFVSAPFRSYLGGLDRYIAGKQMTEETIDTIKRFRASFK
ncbi:MAG TPA: hypothetical protein VHW03_03150 [Chthoniobacterales bacterium]|jgi:hypothetical protein|nr:hypothetical protein [Chthoniobacterales bacterium]